MPPVLRPLSLGELLDQCFQIYRKRFLLFIGISAVPNFFVLIVQALIQVMAFVAVKYQADNSMAVISAAVAGIGMLVALLLYLLVLPLSQAATAVAVSEVHLGRQVTIVGSYRQVVRKAGRYLLIMLEIFLAFLGVAGICALVFAGMRALGSPGLGMFVAAVSFIIAAIFLSIIWALAVPAAAIENIGFVRCVSRSHALAAGARLRILVVMVLAGAITYALMFGIYLPTVLVAVLVSGAGPEGSIGVTVAGLISWFVAVCLAGPLAMIAFTLAYYDQRVRREGFDIHFMMQAQMQTSSAAAGLSGSAAN